MQRNAYLKGGGPRQCSVLKPLGDASHKLHCSLEPTRSIQTCPFAKLQVPSPECPPTLPTILSKANSMLPPLVSPAVPRLYHTWYFPTPSTTG
eukprot:5761308-Pleurochrysis_carterae.AAC.1